MHRRLFIQNILSTILLAGSTSTSHSKSHIFKFSRKLKPVQPSPRLGINLSAITDWNTEFPFNNLMLLSRDWVSQRVGAKWGTGESLKLDEKGWVLELPAGHYATRIISTAGNAYPIGFYNVVYDGEGELKPTFNNIKILESTPGKIKLQVINNNQLLGLDLIKTNPNNPLRNLKVYLPNSVADTGYQTWNPDFLSRWRGIACLRFMDFMSTNNSKQTSWTQRPQLDDISYARNGVPIELMVDLANILKCDAWFCIPHMADDDYVFRLANYVNLNLGHNQKAWFEYSNEVWNSTFKQNSYATEKAKQAGFNAPTWELAWLFTAKRSLEIFKILESVFIDADRLVKVVPAFAAGPKVAETILAFENISEHADALAIAPYISMVISPKGDYPDRIVENWSLEQVFEYLKKIAIPNSLKNMKTNQAIAQRYNLPLVAYEGGQHLVGIWESENNPKLTSLFIKANSDPRMGEIYTTNLNDWELIGGDLFCHFNSVSKWNKWGSWGLMQKLNDIPEQSPKFKALIEWAIAHGQKLKL